MQLKRIELKNIRIIYEKNKNQKKILKKSIYISKKTYYTY